MPSIAITRAYEAVYILDPNAGEEQIAAVTNRYKGLIETQGGRVQKIDVWERRRLAYEIKGRSEGIYVVMQFSGTANVEVELRRVFQISEDQIRYMIVKLDDSEISTAEAPAAEAAAPQPVAAAPVAAEPIDTAPEPAPVATETVATEAVAEPETAGVA